MKIEKKLSGDTMTVALEGRLDTLTAPLLKADLSNSLDGVKELIMDFTDLEYISSAGLRVLLDLNKIMTNKGRMRIVNTSEIVREVFEVTGFTDIITVE